MSNIYYYSIFVMLSHGVNVIQFFGTFPINWWKICKNLSSMADNLKGSA